MLQWIQRTAHVPSPHLIGCPKSSSSCSIAAPTTADSMSSAGSGREGADKDGLSQSGHRRRGSQRALCFSNTLELHIDNISMFARPSRLPQKNSRQPLVKGERLVRSIAVATAGSPPDTVTPIRHRLPSQPASGQRRRCIVMIATGIRQSRRRRRRVHCSATATEAHGDPLEL